MTFPDKSPLIAPALEERLKTLFSRLTDEVEVTAILGDDAKSREMGTFLCHLCALSPLLKLKLLSPGEEPELDAALDAALLPATDDTVRAALHAFRDNQTNTVLGAQLP